MSCLRARASYEGAHRHRIVSLPHHNNTFGKPMLGNTTSLSMLPLPLLIRGVETPVPLFHLTYSPSTYVVAEARRTAAADNLLADLVARIGAELARTAELDRIVAGAERVHIGPAEELRTVPEAAARMLAGFRTAVAVHSLRLEVRAAGLRRSSTSSRLWCRSWDRWRRGSA